MTQERNRRILVIDDNQAIHDDFRKILCGTSRPDNLAAQEASIFGSAKATPKRQTYFVDSALQGQEGYELVRQSVAAEARYALAFVDMRMPPGWDGLQTMQKLWEADPELQVVVCTAYTDYSWDDIFAKFGSNDQLLILKKPFDTMEVCQLVCALTEKWHLARHAHLKLTQLTGMVREQTRELEAANQKLVAEIEQRKSSEERYRLAETGVNDGLWDWDLSTGKVYYSVRFKAMLGYDDGEISDSPQEWFGRVHAEDLPRLRADQQAHLENQTPQIHGEYRILHKDGQYRWMLCRGVAVRGADGTAVRAAGSLTEITDRKMAEEQMRFDAMHDGLTGLPNRIQITERLGRCLARARRESAFRFGVLFLDMDHFKVINDSLGHLVGDKLLVEIGRRMTACARQIDTVARVGQEHVARIGGDEFILLIEGIKEQADVLRVADRVHSALSQPFNLDGHEVCTFVSIGITIGNSTYQKPEDILRDADTALYQAKAAGKACTRLFDPRMHDRVMMRLRTESELRHAIENDELVLHYQPILAAGGQLAAMEALVRWRHPTRGLVHPDAFIPIAEETGLIVPLGRWVLRHACGQLRRWRAQFPSQTDLSVSVNVSSRQFAMPKIADEVAAILAESSLPPRCLTLEIAESAAMQNADLTIQTLGRLHEMGTRIDVDDFGTGYSSLSYLHRMPINALKIDRGFVGPMCDDPMSRSIVQAVVALGHSLRLSVIAEGVESEKHLEAVRKIGCDYVQGYFISKALEMDDATKFIAAQSARRLAHSA